MQKELAFVFVLLMASSLFTAASSTVKAVTEVQTVAKIELIPSVASVGLAIIVNMSVSPSPPTATDLLHGLKAIIVRPDGSLQNHTVIGFGEQQATFNYFGPYTTDGNGTTWFIFVPTMVGTYMVQLEYPGEYFASNTIWYRPSDSMVTNLVVQPGPTPMPTSTPHSTSTPTHPSSRKPSRTTVSASTASISIGNTVMLTGTVIDEASGAPFAQVSVRLIAIDPNGNTLEIGTKISDASGAYGFTWTPPIPGPYTVKATFEGTQTYLNSTDTTNITVNPAEVTPASIPTPNPTTPTAPGQPTAISTPLHTQNPSPIEQSRTQTTPQTGPNLTAIAIVVAMVIVIASLVIVQTVVFRRC